MWHEQFGNAPMKQASHVCEFAPAGLLGQRPAVLITHPIFSAPAFGENHPLSIMRHSAFVDLCMAMNWLETGSVQKAPLADRATLQRFHTSAYLDAFEKSAREMSASSQVRAVYNIGTMECPLFEGLWQRARASVGGSLLAADLALQGYLPFHPGGGTHHGRADRASGFCYLNDPVFAILRLLDAGLERVLYIDLDAHHGDGVEAVFSSNEHVHLISLHEEGRWPGTGQLSDERSARTINVPLPRGVNDDEFLFVFRELCSRRLAPLEPDAVVITCGADALKGDPLSSMNVSNLALSHAVAECTRLSSYALVLGGGGYNPWTTARLWARLWAQMNGLVIPQHIPPQAQKVLEELSCDLIDQEDVDSEWLSSVADRGNPGLIRAACLTLAETACQQV
jgi:acetoin utilization protein AcuC